LHPPAPGFEPSALARTSNLFGYAFKVGAAPENPLSTIEKDQAGTTKKRCPNESSRVIPEKEFSQCQTVSQATTR
jgi:hypothetical protein